MPFYDTQRIPAFDSNAPASVQQRHSLTASSAAAGDAADDVADADVDVDACANAYADADADPDNDADDAVPTGTRPRLGFVVGQLHRRRRFVQATF